MTIYRMLQPRSKLCRPATVFIIPVILILTVALTQRHGIAQEMPDEYMFEEPPVAEDDYAYTESSTTISIDILSNDYGISAPIDPTSVTILAPTATGTTTVDAATGEIEFTPDPGSPASDVLIYEVSDQDGRVSNPAFLWIYVAHFPPMTFDDFDMTFYDESVTIDVLSNDSSGTAPIDPGSVTIVTPPANGSTLVDGVTGEVTYTPNGLFAGSDWFEYVIADIDGVESDVARVDLDVINMPPEIVSFDATSDNYGIWILEGDVQDEHPETTTIEFDGIINGTTTPDATGHFQVSISVPSGTYGSVTATATDELGLQSAPVTVSVYSY